MELLKENTQVNTSNIKVQMQILECYSLSINFYIDTHTHTQVM